MNKFKKSKLPPGTLLYTGEANLPTTIAHVQYNKEFVKSSETVQELLPDAVDWFIVEGFKNVDVIEKFLLDFKVDSLTIEDILNVNQRNKIDVFNNYIFSVQKYSYVLKDVIYYDYISMLLFDDKLITFSEKDNLFVNDILTRLSSPKSIIRNQKHSYLFYVLNDMIIDEKYLVFNNLESRINDLENNLTSIGSKDEKELYSVRKELLFLRNTSAQQLENLFHNKEVTPIIQDAHNKKYYGDLKDHIINLKEKILFEIDVINNLYEMHINNLSHRMNNIMTTLTIFSAIFIPLSFVAGVFGMNFTNFPILQNSNGMLYFLLICLLVPLFMILYFKKKKWF